MRILAPGAVEIYGGRWDVLLGSVFVHGDLMHLAFNLYWLWVFGSVLEANLKRGFWLLLFLVTAVFSSASQLALGGGTIGIGLSGTIYGFFGFMWLAGARYPAFTATLTPGRKGLLLSWLVLCFALTYLKVYQIANLAHVGGLAAGLLLGWLFLRSAKETLQASIVLILFAFASILYAPWSLPFQVVKASTLLKEGQTDRAAVLLAHAATADGPLAGWAAFVLGDLRARHGDYPDAAKTYEAGLSNSEMDPHFLNAYAWLLATAPDARVRDGKKAVKLALRSAELTNWSDAAIIDTLAAAYAEAGDFASAVKWQTTVVEKLDRDDVRQHLRLYQQGQPLRDPAPNAAGTR